MTSGPLFTAWRALAGAAVLGARPAAWWAGVRGDAGRTREWDERLARPRALDGVPRGAVWLHGASVGEVRGLVPLARALHELRPGLPLLVTSTTATGRARAAAETGAVARLAPLDADGPLRRFLAHVQPRLHVVVETEIWPARLARLARAGVPAALVSARLSPERVPRYRRLAALYGPCLRSFAVIAPASAGDRERLLAVGAEPHALAAVGNLKWDAAPAPADAERVAALGAELGLERTRPWIVLGSAHPGEAAALVAATEARAPGDAPGWIVAPRHPERFAEELARLAAGRAGVWRASEGPAPPGTSMLVLDRIGVLPRVYPLARAALLGGTFVPVGGHTPLEAAAAGCPLVAGPHTGHQSDLVEPLAAAGALVPCASIEDAAARLARWLAEPAAARRAGDAAAALVAAQRGVGLRLATLLAGLVPE